MAIKNQLVGARTPLGNILIDIIKKEITNDPEGLGYKGKTKREIVDLLNNPYKKSRVVEDEYPARIQIMLMGIANAPNYVTLEDISATMLNDNREVK